MSAHTDFIRTYSAFIESTMLDEDAFLAGLAQFITPDSVLAEPESLYGPLVGFEGWNTWRKEASATAIRTQVPFTIGQSEFFESGDTVIHAYTVDFGPIEGHPNGYSTSILERFDFADGKIAKLTEYYADTTTYAAFFA